MENFRISIVVNWNLWSIQGYGIVAWTLTKICISLQLALLLSGIKMLNKTFNSEENVRPI